MSHVVHKLTSHTVLTCMSHIVQIVQALSCHMLYIHTVHIVCTHTFTHITLQFLPSIVLIWSALSLACRLIHHFKFSVVVFDTAPTGHTLRFLSIPNLFIKGLSKIQNLKSKFGAVFSQVSTLTSMSRWGSYCDTFLHLVHPRLLLHAVQWGNGLLPT